jgi:hypothetical protein
MARQITKQPNGLIMKYKRFNTWMRRIIRSLWARWKYRNVDPDLCCCGGQLSKAKPWDSICSHGGCRSMKEYCISSTNAESIHPEVTPQDHE